MTYFEWHFFQGPQQWWPCLSYNSWSVSSSITKSMSCYKTITAGQIRSPICLLVCSVSHKIQNNHLWNPMINFIIFLCLFFTLIVKVLENKYFNNLFTIGKFTSNLVSFSCFKEIFFNTRAGNSWKLHQTSRTHLNLFISSDVCCYSLRTSENVIDEGIRMSAESFA